MQKGCLQKQREKIPCPLCDYKSNKKSHLETHINSTHRGATFQCPECDVKLAKYVVKHKSAKLL